MLVYDAGWNLVGAVPASTATGPNQPSELVSDGRYLYVANRGPNTVAVFELGGALPRYVTEVPAGDWPRHIALDGERLYVASERSHEVIVMQIDPATGVPAAAADHRGPEPDRHPAVTSGATGRARARDLGMAPGRLPTGPANAITDVPGIRVGHATVIEGSDIRTGVTAIVHENLLKPGTVPAGLAVFNGFGKMVGTTQLTELGTIETPVLLTSTLSVFRVADALLSYLHDRPDNAAVASLNPVVAETNDGFLSDIWARPITAAARSGRA